MKNYFTVSGIGRLVAAVLLIWALERHPYTYYVLLRWVVCGTGAYSAFVASSSDKTAWTWVLGIIAVIFNPLIPVHLDRNTWAAIDVAAAGVFVVSTFFAREKGRDSSVTRKD